MFSHCIAQAFLSPSRCFYIVATIHNYSFYSYRKNSRKLNYHNSQHRMWLGSFHLGYSQVYIVRCSWLALRMQTFYKLNPSNTFVIKISGIGCANTKHSPLNAGVPVPRVRAKAGLGSGSGLKREQREQMKLIRITTNMTRQWYLFLRLISLDSSLSVAVSLRVPLSPPLEPIVCFWVVCLKLAWSYLQKFN